RRARRSAVPGGHGLRNRRVGASGPGRLDRRGQRPPEPGRDADEGVSMPSPTNALPGIPRRHFFQQGGFGIGGLPLLALLEPELFRPRPAIAADPLAPKPAHFAAKAKSVIFLFMAGGPSQVDLFDPKPKLNAHDGEKIPEDIIKGERFAFIKGVPTLLGSPYAFRRYGRGGAAFSSLLPNTARVADDLLILRSVHTDHFNHAPAQIFMNSGHPLVGRPSVGSWLTYGIGSENTDLPGFVVLLSGRPDPGAGNTCWGSGFLPTAYQGVEFRSQGDPVLSVSNPAGMDRGVRRRELDMV